ncbi:MAG TPA: DUF5819 family protein [Bacteroidia bacterium]|nr:DUF5819 family protein [Bacteroidia bacterium]
MNLITKRVLSVVFVLFLCGHFIMILVYCLSDKTGKQKFDLISRLYVNPVFHQNWNLFVPAPNEERKLFVRYTTNANFSDWEDVLARENALQKNSKVLGNEARVLLISNSLIYELNSLDNVESCVYYKKPQSNEFKVLQFEIEKYLQSVIQVKGVFHYEVLLVSEGKYQTKAYYFKNLKIN